MNLLFLLLLQTEVVLSEDFEQIADITGEYPGWEQIIDEKHPFYNNGSVYFEARNGKQSFKLTSLGGKVRFFKTIEFSKPGYITVRAYSKQIKGEPGNHSIDIEFFHKGKSLSTYKSFPRTSEQWIKHEIKTITPSIYDKIVVGITLDPKNVYSIAVFDDVEVTFFPRLEIKLKGDYLTAEYPNPLRLSIPSFKENAKYELTVENVIAGEEKKLDPKTKDVEVYLDPGFYILKLNEHKDSTKSYISEATVYKSFPVNTSRVGFSINPVKHIYDSFVFLSDYKPDHIKVTIVDGDTITKEQIETLRQETKKTDLLYSISNPISSWREIINDKAVDTIIKSVKPRKLVISDEFTQEKPPADYIKGFVKGLSSPPLILAPPQLDIGQDQTMTDNPSEEADYYIIEMSKDVFQELTENIMKYVEMFKNTPDKRFTLSMDISGPLQVLNGHFFPSWQTLVFNTLNYLSSADQITKLDNFLLPNLDSYLFKFKTSNTILIRNRFYDDIPLQLGKEHETTDIFFKKVKALQTSTIPYLLTGVTDEKVALLNSFKVNSKQEPVAEIRLKREDQKISVSFQNVMNFTEGKTFVELINLPEGITTSNTNITVQGNMWDVSFNTLLQETVEPQDTIVALRLIHTDIEGSDTYVIPFLLKLVTSIDIKMQIKKVGIQNRLDISVTNRENQSVQLSVKISAEGFPSHKEIINLQSLQTQEFSLMLPEIKGDKIRISAVDYKTGLFSNKVYLLDTLN